MNTSRKSLVAAWTPSRLSAALLIAGAGLALLGSSEAQAARPASARVVEHWTPERRAQAVPRDLFIDARGLAYRRGADGTLVPHGHNAPALTPMGKPVGGADTTPPTISSMVPADGAVIGTTQTFSATVTDASSIKSVSFVIYAPGSSAPSTFSATASGSTYSVSLQGFSVGAGWSWQVTAKDKAVPANIATSDLVFFDVSDGTVDPPTPEGVVANAPWVAGGAVQTAAGRIYFEMPSDRRLRRWSGYVCSGTVITDAALDRSIIITAAHCVYDDVYKAFARNVLFIPNQDATTGTGTDLNCANDPLGCWTPAFAVVDVDWTTRSFPDNKQWDYAFYVVSETGAHTGAGSVESLGAAAGSLPVSFATPLTDDGTAGPTTPDYTHALGYSYSDDPNFMYCAEDLTTVGTVNWWLPSCDLSGGSSGGPWVQPMDAATGSGTIMSVNSWGYTTSPGMAGPQIDRNTTAAILTLAACGSLTLADAADGRAGIVVDGTTACP